MRVLIVDDLTLFRQGLISLLENHPTFTVVGSASCAAGAVEQAELLQPDLVLLDFCLPDASGLEAMQQIQSVSPGCQVVFLTMNDSDEALAAAVRKGAQGYLLKSLPLKHLLASLESLERGQPAITREMTGRLFRQLAHEEHNGRSQLSRQVTLSHRETEVLRELSTGATNAEIAQRLYLAENTVKHHVHNILDKLGFDNRFQAAQYFRENGI